MNICQYKDLVATQESYLTSTDVANDYGLSAQSLNKILCKFGFLLNTYDSNRQYKLAEVKYGKYFHFDKTIGEYTESTTWNSRDTLKFSRNGRLMIYKLLKDCNIYPICEQLFNATINDSIFTKEQLDGKFAISCRPPFYFNLTSPSMQTIYISYKSNRNKYSNDAYSINYLPLSDEEFIYIRSQVGTINKIQENNKAFVYLRNFMLNKFYKIINSNNYEELFIKNNKKLASKIIK